MNENQIMLLDAVKTLISAVTRFWPAAWKNEFRNLLIEWLQQEFGKESYEK